MNVFAIVLLAFVLLGGAVVFSRIQPHDAWEREPFEILRRDELQDRQRQCSEAGRVPIGWPQRHRGVEFVEFRCVPNDVAYDAQPKIILEPAR